jgi:hypothetical protein
MQMPLFFKSRIMGRYVFSIIVGILKITLKATGLVIAGCLRLCAEILTSAAIGIKEQIEKL